MRRLLSMRKCSHQYVLNKWRIVFALLYRGFFGAHHVRYAKISMRRLRVGVAMRHLRAWEGQAKPFPRIPPHIFEQAWA